MADDPRRPTEDDPYTRRIRRNGESWVLEAEAVAEDRANADFLEICSIDSMIMDAIDFFGVDIQRSPWRSGYEVGGHYGDTIRAAAVAWLETLSADLTEISRVQTTSKRIEVEAKEGGDRGKRH